MNKFIFLFAGGLCLLAGSKELQAQSNFSVEENFEKPGRQYEKIGRGLCRIAGGVLKTRNAYACFGDPAWTDYEYKFTAKVPESAKQVQIWAGFRAADRDNRYVVALKGGMQNDLYLARLGYMGTDDFLALRHLDFPLLPGKEYTLSVQVVKDRIRVFINNEALPRIDITDEHSSFAPKGKVTLGGGWVENDFSHLSIRALAADALAGVPVREFAPPPVNKEKQRQVERAAYKPVEINRAGNARREVSLDGKWLFAPGYEISGQQEAISPDESDRGWHVLSVPNFWNPDRIWLFGERYGTASKGVSDSYYQKETDRCAAYTFDYKKTNIGWYRQWIELPGDIEGKHLELCFDAVSKTAEVWINGRKAGSHIGMFGDFKIDATGLLKPGKNLLTVKVSRDYVKNMEGANKIIGVAVSEEVTQKMLKDLPHGFYDDDPAGIWQPVSLLITNPLRIEDVFIQPGLNGAAFEVTVKNYAGSAQNFSISTNITSCQPGKNVLYKGVSLKEVHLAPGEQKKFTYHVSGLKPRLWSPAAPNLYDFCFALQVAGHKEVVDRKVIRAGFRTFEVRGGYFYLNGKPYWLRGADQTAMPIAPNDTALAARFCQLMHEGNIAVTRTHTAPYTEAWMNASDKYGVGISYEGTWPWLMLGNTPIPDTALLEIWKNEYLDLVKKYRNHPSLLIWTINNEMNFYVSDPDKDRAEKKMKIISEVVKQMRTIDPTHPVCFASNYSRKQTEKRFGSDFMKSIDDGDIDDIHYYPNWYNNSIFADFSGEFQQEHKYEGRPLISQELSTGYPDETGHAARFYTFVHQTPQAVIGNYAYSYNDPAYFLQTNAFITKEEAEALRRTNPDAAGILHFSLATWFKNVYLAKSITPFPTYYALQKALQPVLVSAALWGRHFYAGTQLPVRICVVNDQEDGHDLPATLLVWQLTDEYGRIIASGKENIPPVKYYGRQWSEPRIMIPKDLPQMKMKGKLILRLSDKAHSIAENEYSILLATRGWAADGARLAGKKLIVVDFSKEILPVLDFLHIGYSALPSIKEGLSQRADIYIFAGLDSSNVSTAEKESIKSLVAQGRKVLLLNSAQIAAKLYPAYIRGVINANPEIVTMDIPESPVFDDIEPLEIRYFNNNKREIPAVCSGAFQVNRNNRVEALASSVKVHGYLQGDIYARRDHLDEIEGFPIVKVEDNKGTVILSTMMLEKGITDPVAGKLLSNLLFALLRK